LGLAIVALAVQAARGDSGHSTCSWISPMPRVHRHGIAVFDEDLPDLSLSFTDSELYVDGAGKIQGFRPGVSLAPELDSTLVLNLSGSLGTRACKADPAAAPKRDRLEQRTETRSGGARLTLDFTGSLQQLSEDDGGGFVVTGKFAGQFRPGLKGIKPMAIKDAAGTLEDFVAMPGISLDTRVVLSDQAMSLAGWVRTPSFTEDLPFRGTGSCRATQI